MTIGTSLQSVARNLLVKFGNTLSRYSYSAATKSEDTEGDITISDWLTASSYKYIARSEMQEVLTDEVHGEESSGPCDIYIKDNDTIAVQDKVVIGTVTYKVTSIDTSAKVLNNLCLQGIHLVRIDGY